MALYWVHAAATQRSKKGSEKVLGKGSGERVLSRVLKRVLLWVSQ